MKHPLTLLATTAVMLCIALATTACGQRVYPQTPDNAVHDSHAY